MTKEELKLSDFRVMKAEDLHEHYSLNIYMNIELLKNWLNIVHKLICKHEIGNLMDWE